MTLPRRPWLVAIAYTDLPSDARVLRETREELRAGARVTIVVPRSGSKRMPPSLAGADVVWLPVDEERGRTTVRGHLRFMRAIREWRREQTERPDIVHVHNMPDYLLLAVRGWQRAGARIVLDVHDVMSHLAAHRFRGVKRMIAGPALRLIERQMWRKADAVITVHNAYAELIASAGQRAVTAVLNVPDPADVNECLRRPTNPASPKMVFHGAVTHRAGILQAVHAMPRILESISTARLLIIGTGDATHDVKSAIAKYSLARAITFDDRYVPLHDAIAAIADADLGLVPTEVSTYTRFMLPVKLTEYAAMGIPAIATRLPLVERYFGDAGAHLLTEATPAAIAEAAIQILSDVGYRDRLAAGAARFAHTHNWSVYADALLRTVGLPNN